MIILTWNSITMIFINNLNISRITRLGSETTKDSDGDQIRSDILVITSILDNKSSANQTNKEY